jgi:hypothetical protein
MNSNVVNKNLILNYLNELEPCFLEDYAYKVLDFIKKLT